MKPRRVSRAARLVRMDAHLPRSPAGRLQFLEEMLHGGSLDDEHGEPTPPGAPLIDEEDARVLMTAANPVPPPLNPFPFKIVGLSGWIPTQAAPDPGRLVTDPRCVYPPPRGPCGVCAYCQLRAFGPEWWLRRDDVIAAIDEVARRNGSFAARPLPNYSLSARGAMAAGWRAWGGLRG